MYHGTQSNFNKFETDKINKNYSSIFL
ncbi:MAG: hypothetical protein LBT04_06860 [Prevotellaceae bacterium]|nr:hypothetical protein [Prevotellaceae bacterium]